MRERDVRIAGGAALALIAFGAVAAVRSNPALDGALDSHPSLVASVASLAVVTIFLISPFLLLVALPTSRIGDGELRSELLEVAEARRLPLLALRRLVRSRRGETNAFAAGVLPGTRVVFLTPRLADGPPSDEVLAVFAHELGHFERSHIAWQMLLLSGATLLMAPAVHLRNALPPGALGVAALAGPAVIWCILFALASRTFELEADLYGAGVLAPQRYQAVLSRLAARRATEGRGARHRGAWIHPSIQRRLEVALAACDAPRSLARLRKRGVALRMGIAALLLAGLSGVAACLAIELGRL